MAVYFLRFDSPVDATEFIFDRPEQFGWGELLAQAAAVVGAGLRISTATVSLNAANSRALRAASGALVTSLTGIPYEFYNDPSTTAGEPADTGTFDTDGSGEALVALDGVSIADGAYGQLVVYHPSDPNVRATYRVPVTIT